MVVTMKIDEVLKRLENIKIDEDEIDERREIARHLAQTFGDKEIRLVYHVMTKDKTIYDFESYKNLLRSNKVSPSDAYVYIENLYFSGYESSGYFYPFLAGRYLLADAYLSKLGLEDDFYHVAPATGLKYVSRVIRFPDINRIVVEVANIDNVTTNTYLPTLKHSDVRNKHIDIDDELDKIVLQLDSRKLFAGHNFDEAREIINRYYEDHEKSLANEVTAINHSYNQIFQPYRIEYDLNTKRIIASFVRKLFNPPSTFSHGAKAPEVEKWQRINPSKKIFPKLRQR